MALFRRKKTTKTNLPKEVDEYYQAERKQRTGIAWLLAIVTVLLTVILALVLYFGGRWVYRKVFHTSSSNNKSTSQSGDKQSSGDTSAVKTTDESNNNTNTPSPSPTSGSSSQSGTSSSGSSSSNGQPTPTPSAVTPTPTPTTTPNTGPGNIILVFVATTIIASFTHNIAQRRR